jgi:hypothetical protein
VVTAKRASLLYFGYRVAAEAGEAEAGVGAAVLVDLAVLAVVVLVVAVQVAAGNKCFNSSINILSIP